MKTLLDRARHLAPRQTAARPAPVRSLAAHEETPAEIEGGQVVFHHQAVLYPVTLQADAAARRRS